MNRTQHTFSDEILPKKSIARGGIIGLAGVIFTFSTSPTRGWVDLLSINYFFLLISLFGMFLLILTNIVGASFVTPYRRVLEALTASIPYLCLLMLPIFGGIHILYEWSHTDVVMNDPILMQKIAYLNTPFFIGRTLVILFIWSFMSRYLVKKFKLQEMNPHLSDKIQLDLVGPSALMMIIFALTFCFSSFDWLMSLEPHWFSTIFGIFTFSGLLVSGFSFVALVIIFLQEKGYLLKEMNENHYHDIGKFMFGFSTFWAYIWFSQYLLIWYANIPEEVRYFFDRFAYYKYTFLPMLIINFLLPLLVLVSSSIKRNYKVVTTMAVLVILGHYVDFFNMIMPGTVGPFWNNAYTFLLVVGAFLFMVGLFVLVVMSALSKLKLIPEGNPLVKESKIFEYPF